MIKGNNVKSILLQCLKGFRNPILTIPLQIAPRDRNFLKQVQELPLLGCINSSDYNSSQVGLRLENFNLLRFLELVGIG